MNREWAEIKSPNPISIDDGLELSSGCNIDTTFEILGTAVDDISAVNEYGNLLNLLKRYSYCYNDYNNSH